MIWTNHFLLSMSRKANKILVKTCSKLVARKPKQCTAMIFHPNYKIWTGKFPKQIRNFKLYNVLRWIYQMISEISNIPDKYSNLLLISSLSVLHKEKRTRLNHCSHSRLISWHIVTMQWACCKPVLMWERAMQKIPKTSHNKPYVAALFGLCCLNPICPRYGYKLSSIASMGEGCFILAFLSFMSSNNFFIHANLSVFQRLLCVSLLSKIIRWQTNLNLCSDIVAPIIFWALSWFQITSLYSLSNIQSKSSS